MNLHANQLIPPESPSLLWPLSEQDRIDLFQRLKRKSANAALSDMAIDLRELQPNCVLIEVPDERTARSIKICSPYSADVLPFYFTSGAGASNRGTLDVIRSADRAREISILLNRDSRVHAAADALEDCAARLRNNIDAPERLRVVADDAAFIVDGFRDELEKHITDYCQQRKHGAMLM